MEKYENIAFRRVGRTKESNDSGMAADKESHVHCLNYDLMIGFIFHSNEKIIMFAKKNSTKLPISLQIN